MNPLELYLNRVARELRSMPSWKQEEELRELRSHLELRVEDFQSEGLNREEAQLRATEAFGSPKALGSNLCDAWEGVSQNWWRVAGAVLKVVAISVVAEIAPQLLGFYPPQLMRLLILRALDPIIIFLFIGVPVCCGGLLSLWLGRRVPKVIMGLLVSLYVVGDLMIFLLDSRAERVTSEKVAVLVFAWTFRLLAWLLGAFLFRLMCQWRWRNLPPGHAPNTKRRNFHFQLRFKPRVR